jgi:hypothetical protein
MPTRRKRPRDPAQLAKLMIDIASGEVEDHDSMRSVDHATIKVAHYPAMTAFAKSLRRE